MDENEKLESEVRELFGITDDTEPADNSQDTEADEKNEGKSVSECVAWAKAQGLDVAKVLAEHFTVEEIAI